jgi:hypothetical protein
MKAPRQTVVDCLGFQSRLILVGCGLKPAGSGKLHCQVITTAGSDVSIRRGRHLSRVVPRLIYEDGSGEESFRLDLKMSWCCHPDTLSSAQAQGIANRACPGQEEGSIEWLQAYRDAYAEQNKGQYPDSLAEYISNLDKLILEKRNSECLKS